MQRLKYIFSIGLIIILLASCKSNYPENIDLAEESEFGDTVNELEHVEMKLNKSIYESEGDKFEVTVENNSEEEVSFGVEYILEYYYKDNWYKVELENEPPFVLLLVTVPPEGKNTDEINLDFYEPLEKGKYRIIRHIGEYPMAAEFEIK